MVVQFLQEHYFENFGNNFMQHPSHFHLIFNWEVLCPSIHCQVSAELYEYDVPWLWPSVLSPFGVIEVRDHRVGSRRRKGGKLIL